MNVRTSAALVVAFLALYMTGGPARAGCQLGKRGEFPLNISDLRALLTAKINGTDETFIVDSGAFYSSITPQVASELQLPLKNPPLGSTFQGVGGNFTYKIATVKELTIFGFPVHNIEFIAGGTEFDGGARAGLIGQNFLRNLGDVEYDFGNGVLRFWRQTDCGKHELAYWVKADQAFSAISIEPPTLQRPHTRGIAYLNGVQIHVLFDTGAPLSTLSLSAAARAGVRPGDPEVKSAGTSSGLGRQLRQTWIAPFANFKIGDEEIHNTHLRIGDIGIDTDMLLGFDFFLSHRVYVSVSQDKLYFTYNGGPVFNLTTQPHPTAPAAVADAHSASGSAEPVQAQPGSAPPGAPAAASGSMDQAGAAEPVDAAGYGRRAAILLIRRDYEHAIADLTRAIELDTTQPQFFYDRAQAYMGQRQSQLATADLDHFLTLKPDDVPALLLRARLHLAARQQPAAIADIDAASHATPKEDGRRLEMGELYQGIGLFGPAIEQYDQWLAAHDEDGRRATGLLMRCRARALEGQELDKALSDCNATVRQLPGTAAARALETRGLVRLRRGELDKSIEDYSAALKLAPKDVWALYGRGVARLRKGATADGQADLATARAQQPRIGEEFVKMGLTP